MNRAYRRAGLPQKIYEEAGVHVCGELVRVSALDHTTRAEGEPPLDFLGYKCPSCGRGWINMSQRVNGELHSSWKAVDELAKDSAGSWTYDSSKAAPTNGNAPDGER